jgi:hypothetical protein
MIIMISRRALPTVLFIAIAASCSASWSTGSFAQARAAFPRAYIGLGLGVGNASLPSSTGQVGATAVTTSSSKSGSTGWKAYAGYRFDPTWGIELGYHNLGNKFEETLATAGGSATAHADVNSWYTAGTATFGVADRFALIGKLGLARHSASIDRVCVGATTCTTPRGSDRWGVVAGIGAEYALTGQYGIRLEYEDYGKITVADVLGTGNSGSLKASAWTLSARMIF